MRALQAIKEKQNDEEDSLVTETRTTTPTAHGNNAGFRDTLDTNAPRITVKKKQSSLRAS